MKIPLVLLILIGHFVRAQKSEYVYLNDLDSTFNCYLAILPDSSKIKGVIVRDFSSLPGSSNKSRFRLHEIAADSGYATLITCSTNFYPELFLNDSGPKNLDTILHHAIRRFNLPVDKIFIGGISASGTRALRYAQFCAQNKSAFGFKIKGVFMVDSPLDHERFYVSSRHVLWRNNPIGNIEESTMIIKVFDQFLGGPPEDHYQNYLESSVFTYSDSAGGNAAYYKDIPMIFYHEPDIDWWLNERGESYYEFNSVDIAAFVVKLRELGNDKVTLITTSGKGFDASGNRKTHSWSIVDEHKLMEWIMVQ